MAAAKRLSANHSGSIMALFEPRFGGGVVDPVGGYTATLQADASSTALLLGRPAIAYDGFQDYVSTNFSSVFTNATTRTFVAPVRQTSAGYGIVVGASGDNYVSVILNDTGGLYFSAVDINTGRQANVTCTAGTAALVALEFDEPNHLITGVVNGTMGTPQVCPESWSGTLGTMQISGAGAWFNGLIGPVAVFNRALTATEHSFLAKAAGT